MRTCVTIAPIMVIARPTAASGVRDGVELEIGHVGGPTHRARRELPWAWTIRLKRMTCHHTFLVMTAHTPSGEPPPMAHSATGIERGSDPGRPDVVVSISVRTLLVAAGIVAVAGALASIGSALLMILVSVLGVAVLSPVATAMERRLGWSRALCSTVLVLGIVVALAVVLLVLAQAVSDAVRGFSHDLPEIVDEVRHSDVGDFINGGSGSLDTLREHATDITKGVASVSGGVADVGVSAFGAVTLFFSVIFLTLFGLNDEPRVRDWIGGLMYRDTRERYLDVTDRIIQVTSRYMLGNLAISVICATVYGVTAVILDLPYPLALALIAGFLDLIPTVGATIAGVIIGVVALSVSLEALVAFAIVMIIYQQVENYVLQPTIIGRAARVSGFTVLVSVLSFGALFGFIGAIIGVPIAAALQILVAELTATRRARIAAADLAEQQQQQPA
jgi:predicted PurR-regulated permease PerM